MNTPQITPTTTLHELALSIAISQLGQQEEPKGSNGGPMVDKYLASVGLPKGYAWCQAFVHWCYEQAAALLKVPCPVTRTGGVGDCWNRTGMDKKYTAKQLQAGVKPLKPGDQFILIFPKGTGHTGLIERVEGNVLHTIEGNSNDDGSREGYEVVRHIRHLTDVALRGCIIY